LHDGARAASPRFGRPSLSAAARIVALLDS
jgi:hypothetical protein